jgi:hypothetical protein
VKIPDTSFHRGVHAKICQAHVRAGRPHAEPAQTVIPDVEYFALQVIPFLKKARSSSADLFRFPKDF